MSGPVGPLPYLGSKISLISNSEIRYEGILYTINTQESTVALQNVKSFGNEGRRSPLVAPSQEVYDFIIFRGKDIKDLTVCEPGKQLPDDPAIVHVNVNPNDSRGGGGRGRRDQGGPAGRWGGSRRVGSDIYHSFIHSRPILIHELAHSLTRLLTRSLRVDYSYATRTSHE
eukprot:GHVU01215889.1.p1 GENE.GHVU01215889.1~~GHVU01215889.1.p1  ORF type:complete len:171 (-),score=17.23 GHVU01215889.1:16-528(-)